MKMIEQERNIVFAMQRTTGSSATFFNVYKLHIISCLIVLLTLSCATANINSTTSSCSPRDQLALASLENVFNLIEKYYIEKVDVSILAKGAIQGMQELIESKQLSYAQTTIDYQTIKNTTDATKLLRRAVFDFHVYSNVDYVQLADSAIRGMLTVLDHETEYMTKEEYSEIAEFYHGRAATTGIDLKRKGQQMINISAIEDTPAYRAGIRPGDSVVEIDGVPTAGMSYENILRRLRGQDRTSVMVTVMREEWQRPRGYKVLREPINQNNVEDRLIDEKLGYIRIKRFSENTEDNLAHSLYKLKKAGITYLILDLRNNPGGGFAHMMKVADQFVLPTNDLFVYLRDRNNEKKEFQPRHERPSYDFLMLVIVNRWSGGASEILAQGLKEWNRALIIGEQTAGAFIARSSIPLMDGGFLLLPTGEYFSPKDISFRKGLTPDIILTGHDIYDPIDFAAMLFQESKNEVSYDRLKEVANLLLAGKLRPHSSKQ